jgi:hypothetical protein
VFASNSKRNAIRQQMAKTTQANEAAERIKQERMLVEREVHTSM